MRENWKSLKSASSLISIKGKKPTFFETCASAFIKLELVVENPVFAQQM
jgi:hypothetical protein